MEWGADLIHHFIIQIQGIIRDDLFKNPYRHMISFFINLQSTLFVTLSYDATFIHFVK